MNLMEIKHKAEALLLEQGLIEWTFTFNNNVNRVGVCRHRQKRIEVSRAFLPNMSDETIFNTLTHEVAHALMGPGYGHGPSWQATHRMLGGDGKRNSVATLPTSAYKWVIKCSVDNRELGRVNRRGARLNRSLCRCHSTTLKWVELR